MNIDWKKLAVVVGLSAAGGALHWAQASGLLPAGVAAVLAPLGVLIAGAMESFMPKGGQS